MKFLHRALLAAAFAVSAASAGAASLETVQCLQMPTAAKAGGAGNNFVNNSRDLGNVTVMELGGDYDRTLGEAVRASAKALYGKGAVRTKALREGAGPLLAVGRRTLRKRR